MTLNDMNLLVVKRGWVVVRNGDRRPCGSGLSLQQAKNHAEHMLRDSNGGEVHILNDAGKLAAKVLVLPDHP